MLDGTNQTVRRTAFYLGSLLLLVVNDHIFKVVCPGWITGKLSDFAGVFALAMFLGSAMPRLFACGAAGAFFVWWKSPLSQPVINALPWQAGRVVDWTDLIALAILVGAFRLLPRSPERTRIGIPLAVLSLFAFAATSQQHASVSVDPKDPIAKIQTCTPREGVLSRFRNCFGVYSPDNKQFQLSIDIRVSGKRRATFTYVAVSEDGVVSVESMQIFGPQPVDTAAAEIAVRDRLVACASACPVAPRGPDS
jgi:hypothetical protein